MKRTSSRTGQVGVILGATLVLYVVVWLVAGDDSSQWIDVIFVVAIAAALLILLPLGLMMRWRRRQAR